MEIIGKYLTYTDLVKSDMAKRLGIINAPTDTQLDNLKALIEHTYDKIIDRLFSFSGSPINKFKLGFNSCFRNETLNKAVGGAKNSQHTTGEAIDLDADIYGHVTNQEIFSFIKNNLEFDQLIAEGLDSKGNVGWVHVSYSKTKNRKQVLVMIKVNGKSKYFPYSETKGLVYSNYIK